MSGKADSPFRRFAESFIRMPFSLPPVSSLRMKPYVASMNVVGFIA